MPSRISEAIELHEDIPAICNSRFNVRMRPVHHTKSTCICAISACLDKEEGLTWGIFAVPKQWKSTFALRNSTVHS